MKFQNPRYKGFKVSIFRISPISIGVSIRLLHHSDWDKMLKVVHGGLNYLQSRSGSLWAGDLSSRGILPISVILQTEIGVWLAVG